MARERLNFEDLMRLHGTVTATGFKPSEKMTFEDWKECGEMLGARLDAARSAMTDLDRIQVYSAQIRDIERDLWQLHGDDRRSARRAIRYRERRIAELCSKAK